MGATPSKRPSGTAAVGEPVQHRAGPDPPQTSPEPAGTGQTREDGHVFDMPRNRFEALVADALDRVPPELAALVDNCVVLVEDDPPAYDPDLLGVYDGTPLTERDQGYTMSLPDRIT